MHVTPELAERAIGIMRAVAAEEILPRYRSVVKIHKDDGSIVTEADYAAQHALVERLRALHDVPVIAEEMAARDQLAIFERGGVFWCVDPLDGTKNFSESIPFFAVSVALMQGASPLFGAVYGPIADEAFHAVRGAGAWLNGETLRLPDSGPPLSQAVAEVGLRRDVSKLRRPLKVRKPYRRRLTSGSATLSWCDLAAGRIDVLLQGGQKMWDYAAGALILEEAGGFISSLAEDDFWEGPLWSRPAIAARTRPLLEEWRAWVRRELAAATSPAP